jgi:hypothetical protein
LIRTLGTLLAVVIVVGGAGCGRQGQARTRSSSRASGSASTSTAGTHTSTIPGIDTSLPPTVERGTIITSAIPRGQKVRGDGDADNPGDRDGNGDIDPEDNDSDEPVPASYRFPDSDDRSVFAWGRPVPGATRAAIAGVLKRYYAAAARGDGLAACQLFTPLLAHGAASEYTLPGQSHHFPTCAALMSAMFAQSRQELSAPISVIAVRGQGRQARAIVASRTLRASSVLLQRQGSNWRLLALSGVVLP